MQTINNEAEHCPAQGTRGLEIVFQVLRKMYDEAHYGDYDDDDGYGGKTNDQNPPGDSKPINFN